MDIISKNMVLMGGVISLYLEVLIDNVILIVENSGQ